MSRPTPAQVEWTRRLLAHEGAPDECAAAAGRTYDKLHAHLAPLVGAAGVRSLFVRSAKLTHREFPCMEAASVDSSTKLRDCLQAQDPAVASHAATALFASFFALITTFIGERLTSEVLRSAWPTIETAPTENDK